MSLFILVVAPVLFLYWLRYSCLMLVESRTSQERAQRVAATIRMAFPDAEKQLQASAGTAAMDRLERSLEFDYKLLTELLRQTNAADPLEQRLLQAHYALSRTWYRITRTVARSQARTALHDMAGVLNYLASEVGQTA